MTPEKEQLLLSFLGTLPEALTLRLVKAVEVDRLAGGSQLPHDLILQGLRPMLRRAANPERTPTPLRLFCQPFQDLLISEPRKSKQKARIARTSATKVWNWLRDTLIPAEHSAYELAAKEAILGYKADDANAIAAAFWSTAADALRNALKDEKGKKAARVALEGDMAVADAEEIALVLSVGPDIIELQTFMPRPQPTLNDELTWKLRQIYDRFAERAADAAPYVAVIAMNRLMRPWEALRLPILVTRNAGDALISSTDMGLPGELLFADMELHATAIRNLKSTQVFDAESLVSHVSRFAELSTGLVKEMEVRRDGRWGQRLLKERAAVGGSMDAFMERAPRDISAALPTIKTGTYAGGPRAPDLAHAPDPEKAQRAIAFAHLIRGCRNVAAAACFGAKLKDASDEANLVLKSYNEDIVKELRASEGARRDIAELYFNLAAELTSILYSPEEGEFLRRRGRAALGVAAAA